MTFNPIKLIRRRKRLHQAIQEEVHFLMRSYDSGAHQAALDKLQRPDLTNWGRQVLDGVVKQLERKNRQAPVLGRWLRQVTRSTGRGA